MSILRRITNLFHRSELDQEIEAELRSHIEMRTADNIAAGMSPEEARRDALLRFGNRAVLKERVTAADAQMFLDSLWQDLQYGLRMLRKSPGFTAVAVLTLAVAIGVNATVFGMVNGILFRGLPVPHPSGLVSFGFGYKGYQALTSSYLDLQDVRQQAGRLVDLFAYETGTDGLTVGDHTDRIVTNYVTGNYFDVLGVKPALGRLILPFEGKPGGYDPMIVLSYSKPTRRNRLRWQSSTKRSRTSFGRTKTPLGSASASPAHRAVDRRSGGSRGQHVRGGLEEANALLLSARFRNLHFLQDPSRADGRLAGDDGRNGGGSGPGVGSDRAGFGSADDAADARQLVRTTPKPRGRAGSEQPPPNTLRAELRRPIRCPSETDSSL
jgi:MacB-like periplasmic core domain